MKRFSELDIGESAKILEIEGPTFIKRRLLNMGLIPGGKIEVKKSFFRCSNRYNC